MSDLEVNKNNQDEIVSAVAVESKRTSDFAKENISEVKNNDTEDSLTSNQKDSWGTLENLELDFESDVNVKEHDLHNIERNHSEKIAEGEEFKIKECTEIKKEPEETDEGEISDSDIENGEENETNNISNNAKHPEDNCDEVKKHGLHNMEENRSGKIVKVDQIKIKDIKEIKKEPEETDEGEISDSDIENGEENETNCCSKNAQNTEENCGEVKKEFENKDEGEISDDNDLEEGELGEEAAQVENKFQPPDRQICRFFIRGNCFFGVDCRYLHMQNNSLHGNYTMFPNTFKENQNFPYRRKNIYPRRFGSNFNEKDNTNFVRNRDRYHQNVYNCDENQTQYRKEFSDSTWKRDYDNSEMHYGNRDYVPSLYREKSPSRSFRKNSPSDKERDVSIPPRRRERSRSGSGSYSDGFSDSDNSSLSSFSSSLSSYSRSSYGSSRSPSPSDRKSPDESILSLKCEILKTKSEGRNSRNQSYAQSISHSPVSRASSCSSRGDRSVMPDSSNKDESSKFSLGIKRPLSPEMSAVPTKHMPDQNLDNSAKSRREYLLEQLKVVEDAIARKRSKN